MTSDEKQKESTFLKWYDAPCDYPRDINGSGGSLQTGIRALCEVEVNTYA